MTNRSVPTNNFRTLLVVVLLLSSLLLGKETRATTTVTGAEAFQQVQTVPTGCRVVRRTIATSILQQQQQQQQQRKQHVFGKESEKYTIITTVPTGILLQSYARIMQSSSVRRIPVRGVSLLKLVPEEKSNISIRIDDITTKKNDFDNDSTMESSSSFLTDDNVDSNNNVNDSSNNNKQRNWKIPQQNYNGVSLIDQTLQQIQTDNEYIQIQNKISSIGLDGMTKEERIARRRALDIQGITTSFQQYIQTKHSISLSTRNVPKIMQINIGLYCNQACSHCHVESSPLRIEENMSMETIVQCLKLLKNSPTITTLDITGGAPELNSNFRYLVSMARILRPDIDIIDRCNLTVLHEPGQGKELIDFFVQNNVRIVASLPCYDAKNVNEQRGNQVFERSISALILLNEAGYGIVSCTKEEDNTSTTVSGTVPGEEKQHQQQQQQQLQLDLVYNPNGAFLPPSQSNLQKAYSTELYNTYGIRFNELLTITNMPIKRFADYLVRTKKMNEYMKLLIDNFNPVTISNVMCLDTISISWDGTIYDCDFNQQLGYKLPLAIPTISKTSSFTGDYHDDHNDDAHYDDSTNDDQNDDDNNNNNSNSNNNNKRYVTIFDIDTLTDLQKYKIRTDNHCFGCTAGAGSSCQGATA